MLAAGILVAGGILNIFLGAFITTDIPMSSAHLYFFLFTLSIFAGYLTYTYRLVLFGAQQNRISSLATLAAEIIFRGAAALTAILFKSYTLFLICFICEKLLGNFICCVYVKKRYKGITCWAGGEDSAELRKAILTTVKPLFVTRVADIVQNSSQSIFISILLGNIAIVGYYGNYTLVTGAVGLLFSQLGAAFTSSFGNLAIDKDKLKMYEAFRKTDFIMVSIAVVMCSGFLACIQDFITLAFGPQFVLGNFSVVILMLTMLVTTVNIPVVSIQNATGCHDADVKIMVIQAIGSVACGFIGGFFFDMEGILLGMLIPMTAFTTLGKNIIIQKKLFDKKCSDVLKHLSVILLKSAVVISAATLVTNFINTGSLLMNIFVKGVVAVFVSVLALIITSFKSKYFHSTVLLFKSFVTSVIGKKKA
jgi:O-antigen/teichoic acid export membrane protein